MLRGKYRCVRKQQGSKTAVFWETLLHQAADGLRVSGRVIHRQAFNELCLCIQQSAVLLELVGVTGLLCGLEHGKHGVVDIQLQHLVALYALAAGLLGQHLFHFDGQRAVGTQTHGVIASDGWRP